MPWCVVFWFYCRILHFDMTGTIVKCNVLQLQVKIWLFFHEFCFKQMDFTWKLFIWLVLVGLIHHTLMSSYRKITMSVTCFVWTFLCAFFIFFIFKPNSPFICYFTKFTFKNLKLTLKQKPYQGTLTIHKVSVLIIVIFVAVVVTCCYLVISWICLSTPPPTPPLFFLLSPSSFG